MFSTTFACFRIVFSWPEFQRLQMFCRREQEPSVVAGAGTGKQLFNLLLSENFDDNGEIVFSSNLSSWLENVYGYLIKRFLGKEFLEFLDSSQDVLVECLSMRRFSVSLFNLYMTSDSRPNMNEEILCGYVRRRSKRTGRNEDFLSGNAAGDGGSESEKVCYERQKSVALSQAAAAAFKCVFSDDHSLVYSYAGEGNSFLSMI